MHVAVHAGWAYSDNRKGEVDSHTGPHSSLVVTPPLKSSAKKQGLVTCVELTVQLLARAGPLDLHSRPHLAGACHCLLARALL